MIYYLQSCNFTAASPGASKKIRGYMEKKADVKVPGCCRPSQKLFQEGDTVLTICLTCSAITREVSPQVTEMSFWEYALGDPDFPWPDYHGEKMTIQDCWRAREKDSLMRAVRECMKRMNIEPVELGENFGNTRFDGVWRFNPVQKRNKDMAPVYFGEVENHGLELIPQEQQVRRMKEWVSQYQTERAVAYCNACLRGMQMGGADGIHLMELMTANL